MSLPHREAGGWRRIPRRRFWGISSAALVVIAVLVLPIPFTVHGGAACTADPVATCESFRETEWVSLWKLLSR
ncbi:hypothetical protein FM113_08835 [Leucobacter sp. 7(1)]|uniref:hypothetical protein n=1 Tax=Leucobacter sp. 7(1) TaxID=1255613 RepID=UPI00097F48B6|nr:hypothetical protein [Leucobacter sp. 7(1)]SJN10329.1 hypothetical protein FM113_08835 [Leucobacter sp. 7(1)]